MELFSQFVNFLLSLSSTLFMPLIIIVVGLAVKMKLKDAITSGLVLGIGLVGVNMVVAYMMGAITPALNGFIENTGVALTSIDVGWTIASAITWAWPYVFFMFIIHIVINLVMVSLHWTDTLNIDLWNVWGNAFAAVIVTYFCDNPWIGLVVGAVCVVLELKLGDAIALQVQNQSGIPGVTLPHPMMLSAIPLYPVDLVLRKIPALNKKFDVDALREKIGIFGENHIMGFILGTVIALVGGYDVIKALTLGVEIAACFMILPMVTKLFMQALSPISEVAGDFMKSKFKNREFHIGLDWPFLAGCNEIWVTAIITAPLCVLLAMVVPGNGTLPLSSIIMVGVVVSAFVITNGNVLRMILLTIISIPVELIVATYLAPALTNLATSTGAYAVEAGQQITFYGQEGSIFRTITALVVQGNVVGYVLLVAFVVLFVWFYKDKMKESRQFNENE